VSLKQIGPAVSCYYLVVQQKLANARHFQEDGLDSRDTQRQAVNQACQLPTSRRKLEQTSDVFITVSCELDSQVAFIQPLFRLHKRDPHRPVTLLQAYRLFVFFFGATFLFCSPFLEDQRL